MSYPPRVSATRSRTLALALLLLWSLAAACATQRATPAAEPSRSPVFTGAPVISPLVGEPGNELFGDWRLVAGQFQGQAFQLVAAQPIKLTIRPNRVSGESGCNNYQADASIDSVHFGVGLAARSAMGCGPPEVMALENAYISALASVEVWLLDPGQLFLRGPNVELRFRPIGPIDLQAITDRTWMLQALVRSGGPQTPAHAGGTLELGFNGRLAGSTGCRAMTGTYIEQAGEIHATQLSMDGDCVQALRDQDSLVVTVLGDGFTAEILDGALVTSTGDDWLVYGAAEVPPT